MRPVGCATHAARLAQGNAMATPMTRLRNGLLLAVLGLFVAGAAGISVTGYNALRYIEDQGGLTQFLQDNLNNRMSGVFGTIESTRLEFRLSSAPVRVIAKNIRLGAVDAALVLPRSEFGLSALNLIRGRIVPTEMEVSGLELDIEHGDGGWQAGPSVALIAGMLEKGGGLGQGGGLGDFRTVRIVDARLKITRAGQEGGADGELVVIEPVEIAVSRRGGRLEGRVIAANSGGGRAMVDFTSDAAATDMDLTATVAGLRVSSIYPYLGIDIPEISEVGVVEGVFSISIRDRAVAGLSGDVIALEGRVELPGREPLDYNRAELVFAYDTDSDLLTVTNLDLHAPVLPVERTSQPWRFIVSGQVKDISGSTPVVIASLKAGNLPLDPILDAWPEDLEPTVRDMVTGSVQGGNIAALGLEIVGVVDRGARLFRVTSIDMVGEMRSMRLETSFASVDRLVGTLSSRLELSMANGGAIRHAAANLLLEDAQLLPKDSSRLVELEGIELRASLDGNKLLVERAAIDARKLGQMALMANFELDSARQPRRLDLQARAEQIDMRLLSELWPRDLRPETRRWVAGNIGAGVINGLVVDAGFALSPENRYETLYLKGKAGLADATLGYLDSMPPVEGVNASIGFEGRTLRANIVSGTVEGLAIDGSRFIIRASEAGPEADLALLAKGDFGGAARLLDNEHLNLLAPAGINLLDAGGAVDATMGMKWLIPGEGESIGDKGGIDISLTASVEGGMLDGLPYATRLDNGSLDIVLSGNNLTIGGRGEIEGAPTVLDLRRRADGHVEMELAVASSEQLTRWIRSQIPLALGGKTAGRIKLKGNPRMSDLVMDTTLDLDDASIDLARLGLVKLQGEEAELVGRFRFGEGRIASIGDIRLESDVLSIDGNISFDETGRFLGAHFNEVSWPGNDLRSIAVERNAENILRVSAEAGVVDLSPLRREKSPGEGVSLEVDLTAERVILDRSVSLSGNVVFKTAEDGVGDADFHGVLFLGGEPFMTEASLKAVFGGGQDRMEGVGLIGGAEAALSLSPGKGDGSLMELRSGNAGQVLKTLEVTEAIRSGELVMQVTFDDNQPGHYNANFELKDFNVIDAPQAVRMMSVLSLPGLLSLLDGDGTNFREGSARIEVSPDKQIIHHAQATGAAVGVDLVGVIHPQEGTMEVSGTLAPFNLIAEIIGIVPLVGEILTGFDKSGIVATQFTLTGPVDDPVGTVNRSSIAPGFLRDIFSPNWVHRERERLIPGNSSSGESQDAAGGSTGN